MFVNLYFSKIIQIKLNIENLYIKKLKFFCIFTNN